MTETNIPKVNPFALVKPRAEIMGETPPLAPVKVDPFTLTKTPLPVNSSAPVKVDPFEVEPVSLTQDQLMANPEKMSGIRTYMVGRMGKQYTNSTNEELLDDFITHMRWVNTNEVNTFGEARHVLSLDEETRMTYGDAYKSYDELGSFLTSGGISGALEGAFDYTFATLASPSTWIGGIVGRGIAKIATTGVKRSLLLATTRAVETAVTKASGKAAGITARGVVVSAAAKRSAAITVGVAGITDGTIAGLSNNAYQKVMMETGVQDDYSALETAVSVLGGGVGAGLMYSSTLAKNLTGLADAGQKITVAKTVRASKAKEAVVPELKAAVEKLAQDWGELAKRGDNIDPNKFLRDSSVNWFVSWKNENSFVRILQRNGADIDLSEGVPFSAQLTEFAAGLPQETRDQWTDALRPLGVTFSDMIDIFASTIKQGATDVGEASLAKQRMKDLQNVAVAKRTAAQNLIVDAASGVADKADDLAPDKDTLGYMTSVWKRVLVSHPATTMLNVKGWGFSMAGRTLAELAHGSALQIVGRAKQMAGVPTAALNLSQSSALFKSQWFMAKTLADPFTSVEAFSELLNRAPKKIQKEALATFFAGVGDERAARFGFDETTGIVKGVEKAVDVASTISLVRIQDIYTKTFSGLKELDKLSRINLNTGLSDLLNTGRTNEITEDMWNGTIQALLRDTMSVDYTKTGNTTLKSLASLVEKASNTPGVGFLMPFGRFMNNTVAFTMAYSPIGMAGVASKIYKEGFTMDLTDKVMRSIVGTTALAMVAVKEGQKQEAGLQWYEEKTDTGEIQNVQNLFPLGLYNLMGRMSHLSIKGEGIPKDMWTELGKQVGPLAAVQGISDNSVMLELGKYLSDTKGDEDATTEFFKLMGFATASVAGTVFSGFTRPLDPYNDLIGAVGDLNGSVADVAIDKKQAEGVDAVLQNFGRYTNHFFNLALGTPVEKGSGKVIYGKPAQSATEDKFVKDSNPLSRMVGAPMETTRTNIDILLGQTNFPPFKMNSYTANPEYNAFINDRVFPILERKATNLLAGDYYKKAPTHVKRSMVTKILSDSRDEVLDLLDQGFVGGADERLINDRRKFSGLPEALRIEAKKALEITTSDRKLTPYQVEALNQWISLEKDLQKGFLVDK